MLEFVNISMKFNQFLIKSCQKSSSGTQITAIRMTFEKEKKFKKIIDYIVDFQELFRVKFIEDEIETEGNEIHSPIFGPMSL